MAKALSFTDRIDALVNSRLESMIEKMMGGVNGEPDAPASPRRELSAWAPSGVMLEQGTGHAVPARTVRHRVQGPQVEYVVVRAPKKGEHLFPTLAQTLAFLVKRKRATTMRQTAEGTGLKPKTVESTLYQLRSLGIIKSQPYGTEAAPAKKGQRRGKR